MSKNKTTVSFKWHEEQMNLASKERNYFYDRYNAELNNNVDLRKENLALKEALVDVILHYRKEK